MESVNKSIKDGKFLPIDDPENRPRRGWIAQLLAVTTMVAATHVRKTVEQDTCPGGGGEFGHDST